jgi:hypothetical protein
LNDRYSVCDFKRQILLKLAVRVHQALVVPSLFNARLVEQFFVDLGVRLKVAVRERGCLAVSPDQC